MSRLNALAWLAVCAAGCDMGVGPTAEWVPIDDLAGDITAELGAPPTPPSGPTLASGDVPATRYSGIDAAAKPVIRVASYNVEEGGRIDDIAAAFRDDPDLESVTLLFVQEAERHGEASGMRDLAEQLGWGWVYVPARFKDGGTQGLAVLSPYPLDNVERMELPHADGGTERIAIRADIDVDGRRLRIINVHLDTKLNITDRIVQLRPAVIDAAPSAIVAGDFNTNPYLWQATTIPNRPAAAVADTDQAPLVDDYMAGLGFATPTAGLGPTEHKYGVESRLDAIYVRGLAARPGEVRRDIELSDHWPLWIDVTLQ